MKYLDRIVMWCHGTIRNQWKDSGWTYNGKFYPCKYTNGQNGTDKVIGKILLELEGLDKRARASSL